MDITYYAGKDNPEEMWEFLQKNNISFQHGKDVFIKKFNVYPYWYWDRLNELSRLRFTDKKLVSKQEFFKNYIKTIWI